MAHTSGRGGRREGAGRPRSVWSMGKRRKEVRVARPKFEGWRAFHVTQSVSTAVGRLRRRDAYHAVRKAMACAYRRENFRIVQISLQGDHMHILVEAASGAALQKGMHGFLISAARRLNGTFDSPGRRARLVRDAAGKQRAIGALRRGACGPVFERRYHLVAITSARQARNTLNYLLNNFRHHRESESADWAVDYYSSGSFRGWSEYRSSPQPFQTFPAYEPLPVRPARTHFLATGWRSAGPISLHDIPCSMPFEGGHISMKHARPWG
jgi:putative transposase